MRITYRNYCQMETALSCINAHDLLSGERRKVGDIIDVRDPIGVIGFKESKTFLWITLEGLEQLEYNAFVAGIDGEEGISFDKRRLCIPFHRIEQLYPSFDIARAIDPDDIYQPFFILDNDTHEFLEQNHIFQVSGLVFDKVTGMYL